MTGYFSRISGQNSRQLAETGNGELWLSVFLYLGPIVVLAAGWIGCALVTWHLSAGEKKWEKQWWYGISAAGFFLLGAMSCREAMKLPVFSDAGGQKWELEQLDGEWVQGKGILEQVTEKEGTVTLLIEQVQLEEPCQGEMECSLYLKVEEEQEEAEIAIKEEMDSLSADKKEGFFYQNCRPGQVICFRGEFSRYSEATNPGAFDYRAYCWSLGIAGQVEAKADQLQIAGNGSVIRYQLQRLRFFLRERLLQLAQPSDAGILICLLTGDKSELDNYWKELYEEASILHLLSLSGLHVGILGMGAFHLFRRLFGSFFWSSLISGIFMVAFCVMTGSGTSMVRAMICFLLFLLAGYTGRTYDLPTATSVAGILLLLEHPLILFQAGFLMTFSCVMGISFLLPLGELIFVEDIREDQRNQKKIPWTLGIVGKEGQILKQKAQKSLLSAALLQLSSLPAVLWFQGAASLAGPLINLLTVPLMDLVLISDLLAVGVSLISMNAGVFLLGPAHYILGWYEKVCMFFNELPLRIAAGRPYGWQIFLWLVLLAGILLFGYRQLIWKHKRLPFFLGLLLFPCTILLLQRVPSSDLNIYFLDVGQGDGIVLELPKKQGIFCIDGGSSSQTKLKEYVYEPYFSYAGIDKVDGWLITHPDSDHYSGMLSLLEDGFEIEHIFIPEQFRESELAQQIEVLHSIEYITAGDVIRMGELQFEFLHPDVDYSTADANDASAVVYATWKEFSALFTGDISEAVETEIVQKLNGREVDLLKASHHGSKTATSQVFLEGIFAENQENDQAAVISCGANNRYGHPHQEVLERLEAAGVSIYRTDQSGCIQIVSQGEERYQVKSFSDYI